MENLVDAAATVDLRHRFECRHCGHVAFALVRGVGFGSADGSDFVAANADVRAAERISREDARGNAALTAGLARCPRCSRRDAKAVRRFWSRTIGTLVLAAFASSALVTALLVWGDPRWVLIAWLVAAGAAVLLPAYYLVGIRWRWTSIDERVAFESDDATAWAGTLPRPILQRPTDTLGPWLMIAFGTLALGYSGWTVARLQRNPTPVSVPCDRAALDVLEIDRWVELHGCRIDVERALVLERDHDPEALVVPLVPADAPTPGTAVAFLVTDEYRVMKLLENVDDVTDLHEEITTALHAQIRMDPLDGMTSLRADDREVRARFAGLGDRVLAIEPGEEPRLAHVIFTLAAALALLTAAAIYWPRQRWTREPVASR
jgi:hypothetical protein